MQINVSPTALVGLPRQHVLVCCLWNRRIGDTTHALGKIRRALDFGSSVHKPVDRVESTQHPEEARTSNGHILPLFIKKSKKATVKHFAPLARGIPTSTCTKKRQRQKQTHASSSRTGQTPTSAIDHRRGRRSIAFPLVR